MSPSFKKEGRRSSSSGSGLGLGIKSELRFELIAARNLISEGGLLYQVCQRMRAEALLISGSLILFWLKKFYFALSGNRIEPRLLGISASFLMKDVITESSGASSSLRPTFWLEASASFSSSSCFFLPKKRGLRRAIRHSLSLLSMSSLPSDCSELEEEISGTCLLGACFFSLSSKLTKLKAECAFLLFLELSCSCFNFCR